MAQPPRSIFGRAVQDMGRKDSREGEGNAAKVSSHLSPPAASHASPYGAPTSPGYPPIIIKGRGSLTSAGSSATLDHLPPPVKDDFIPPPTHHTIKRVPSKSKTDGSVSPDKPKAGMGGFFPQRQQIKKPATEWTHRAGPASSTSSSSAATAPNVPEPSPSTSLPPRPEPSSVPAASLATTSRSGQPAINRNSKYGLGDSDDRPRLSPPPAALTSTDVKMSPPRRAPSPPKDKSAHADGSEDGEVVEDENGNIVEPSDVKEADGPDGGWAGRSPRRDRSRSTSRETKDAPAAGSSKDAGYGAGSWDDGPSSSQPNGRDSRSSGGYQRQEDKYRGDHGPPRGGGRADQGWVPYGRLPDRDLRTDLRRPPGGAGGSRGPYTSGNFAPPMAERLPYPPPSALPLPPRPGQGPPPGARGGPLPPPRDEAYGPRPPPMQSSLPDRLPPGPPGPYDRQRDSRMDGVRDQGRLPLSQSSSASDEWRRGDDHRERDRYSDRDRGGDRRDRDREYDSSSSRRDGQDDYARDRDRDDRRSDRGGNGYRDEPFASSSSSKHKPDRYEDDRRERESRKRQKTEDRRTNGDQNDRVEQAASETKREHRRSYPGDREREQGEHRRSRRDSRSPVSRRRSSSSRSRSRSRSRTRSPRRYRDRSPPPAKETDTPEHSPPPSPEKVARSLPDASRSEPSTQFDEVMSDASSIKPSWQPLTKDSASEQSTPALSIRAGVDGDAPRHNEPSARSPVKRRRSSSPPSPRHAPPPPPPPPPPPKEEAPSSPPPPPPAHSPPPPPPASHSTLLTQSPKFVPASPMSGVISPKLEHQAPPPPPPPPSTTKTAPPTPKPTRPLSSSVAKLVEPSSSSSHRSAPSTRPGTPSSKGKERKKRTRTDEEAAYGHCFSGTSDPSKYPIAGKLGEGTFGEVHKSTCKETGKVVALKRILVHSENDGVPITTLREIKLLKALDHPNVVPVVDMILAPGDESTQHRGKIFMVFPFADHDLAGLLENPQVNWDHKLIKLYSMQLLRGTAYLHANSILHRDMKTANLLINNQGVLQIADFGLARSFSAGGKRGGSTDVDGKQYTNMVVTRWYRPPELLLGLKTYGPSIDVWGVGCVISEMITKKPIMQGNSDQEQLTKIYDLCGTPNDANMPGWNTWGGCEGSTMMPHHPIARRVVAKFENNGRDFADLIDKLLTLDPHRRISAREALEHIYFWQLPLPMKPEDLPIWNSSHEFTRKKKPVTYQPIPAAQPPVHPPPRQPPGLPHPQQGGGGGFPAYPPPGFGGQQPQFPIVPQQPVYGVMAQQQQPMLPYGQQAGFQQQQQPGFFGGQQQQQQPNVSYGIQNQSYGGRPNHHHHHTNNARGPGPAPYPPPAPNVPNPYAGMGTSGSTTRAPSRAVHAGSTMGNRNGAAGGGAGAMPGFLKPKPQGMSFAPPKAGGGGPPGGPRAGKGGAGGGAGAGGGGQGGGGNGGLPY